MEFNKKRIAPLFLEDAEVLPGGFRNFSGRASKYNKEGNRNFSIVIRDTSFAEQLRDDGWNIVAMTPRGEDDEPGWKLNIAVNFRRLERLPPLKVYLYTGTKRTLLTEDTIDALDYADFQTADLTIRPRFWTDERTNERHIKAYLQEMHVVIQEDRWSKKYADYNDQIPPVN